MQAIAARSSGAAGGLALGDLGLRGDSQLPRQLFRRGSFVREGITAPRRAYVDPDPRLTLGLRQFRRRLVPPFPMLPTR